MYSTRDDRWLGAEFEDLKRGYRQRILAAVLLNFRLHHMRDKLSIHRSSIQGGGAMTLLRFKGLVLNVLVFVVLANGALKAEPAQNIDQFKPLYDQVVQLFQRQKYQEAAPLAERAVTASVATFGEDHPATISTRVYLGRIYMDLGRYKEAEPILKKTIASCIRAFGEKDRRTLAAMSDLSHLYAHQGRNREAEQLIRKGLAAAERFLDKDDRATLASLSDLAAIYVALGQYSDAEGLYKKVTGRKGACAGR